MRKILILAFVISTVMSCSIMDCKQKDELFTTEYHTYQIEFEEDINVEYLLDKMINRYCVEKVENDLPFVLYDMEKQKFVSKKSSKTLKIGIEPPLCFEAKYDLEQILEIVKEHNNYRVEGDIVPTDKLSNLVESHYYNNNSEDKLSASELKGIWIILERKEGINDAAEIIAHIVKGFVAAADKIAQEEFNKPYCDLIEEEVKYINEKFVFRLSYKYYVQEADIKLNNNI